MSTSYLDLNGLGYLWDKAKDKFASKDISATDIEAVGISKVTSEGNPVAIDDVPYEQEADDIVVEFDPIQDLHGYDHPWPAGGGKNLCPYFTQWGSDIGTIQVTFNADGSISLNGTNTDAAKVVAYSDAVTVYTGIEYVLSGCPTGGSINSYRIDIRSDSSITALDTELGSKYDYGNGVTFTPSTTHDVRFAVRLAPNAQINNLTFYPMLRLSSVGDASYAPYSNICQIYPANGKNLLPNTLIDATQNGISISITADKKIRISGTGDGEVNSFFYLCGGLSSFPLLLKKGMYVLSQGIALQTNCFLRISGENGTIAQVDGGSSAGFTLDSDTYVHCYLRIDKNANFTNQMTIEPMICRASIADPAYVPYQAISVDRAGKNLLTNTLKTITYNGVEFIVNSDGSVLLNGTANGTAQRPINPSLILHAGTYVLTGMASGGSSSTRMIYISDGSKIIARDTGEGATFTISEKKAISVLCWVANGVEVNGLQINPMIQKSDVMDDTFEPYHSESIAISLGDTVYGGTLDVKSGVLTVTHGIVDMGDLEWIHDSLDRFYTNSLADVVSKPTATTISLDVFRCSALYNNNTPINPSSVNRADNTIALYRTGVFYTYAPSFGDDVTAFKTFFTGQTICYKLATPITYQLTPHQLTLLKKYNVITSDASNIRITYDGKSDSTIQSELDELNETIFMIKQSISNSQIDNMFDALDE